MPTKSLCGVAFWAPVAILGFVATADLSASERVQLKVHRIARSASPGAISNIGGFVGERLRANREGYLHRFDIERYVRMTEEKLIAERR